MQGHISKLHCHYRIYGNRANYSAIENRLNALVKQDVIEAYEHALDQVYGDDEQVVIVRRLHSNLFLSLDRDKNDNQLARQWGYKMAADLVKTIDTTPDSEEFIKRFDNQSQYIAHFISKSMQGNQWDHWYFGAFRHLKNKNLNQIIYDILRENPESVTSVIAELQKQRILLDLLDRIEPTLTANLWQNIRRSSKSESVLLYKPSLEEALRLLKALLAKQGFSWQSGPLDNSILMRLENLLSAYTWLDIEYTRSMLMVYFSAQTNNPDTTGDEDIYNVEIPSDLGNNNYQSDARRKARELFEQVCLWVGRAQLWAKTDADIDAIFSVFDSQVVIDWQDRESLSNAFLEMLRHLNNRGYLIPIDSERKPESPTLLHDALASLDWLDTSMIIEFLQTELGNKQLSEQKQALSLTRRQKNVVTDLAAILNTVTIPNRLFLNPSPKAMSTYLYAALCERYPNWNGDTFALQLIDHTVTLVLDYKEQGHIFGHNTYLKHLLVSIDSIRETRPALATAVRFLSQYEDATTVILPAVLREHNSLHPTLFSTQCAGVFLLVRAINDLKLPRLIEESHLVDSAHNYSLPVYMSALIARLAGLSRDAEFAQDPAIHWLLGRPDASENQLQFEFRDVWNDWNENSLQAIEGINTTLARNVAGLRLLSGAEWFVYKIQNQNGQYQPWMPVEDQAGAEKEHTSILLMVGNANGNVWPMVQSAGVSNSNGELDSKPFIKHFTNVTGVSSDAIVTQDSLFNPEQQQVYQQGVIKLCDSLNAVKEFSVGGQSADISLSLCAITVLRAWARWLPRMSTASIDYLVSNFIRREGALDISDEVISVELEPAPLDIVTEMAGYFEDIENIHWLGGRTMRFRVRP